MYTKLLKKLSAIVFAVVVFFCIFILCSCGNKNDSPTEVITNNTTEPATVSEVTNSNDAAENNSDVAFKAGKYLVNIDKKIICAKDDGLYFKEGLESEGKKISNEKNVYTIMFDGETVFYAEGYDVADFGQRNTPKKVYITTISKNTSELLFESDGYIELIGLRNNCIYYLDQNQSNESAVMKFNITDNSKSKLTKDWNGQILSPCILGDKLYAYLKSNDSSNGTFRAYDLSTSKFEDIYSGMMSHNVFNNENRIIFDTFAISESSGNKKNDHVTYTIEKDGTVKKSPEIKEDCSFEYATPDGKYGLYFSTPSSGKFDLYTIDLESGEVFTSENDAASCIGKNYFVTSDLLHPENIYFMYNLKLYDINTKSAKKISHEDFEIDITKPMWIIDGCIVDWKLNTYKIYDESTAEQTTEQIAEESSTVTVSSEWKDMYVDYINSIDMGAGMEKFALFDVDGNGIPELFYNSGFDMGGGSLSTVFQGQINTIRTGSGGIFYWNSRISCIGGRQGRYAKKVFDISGGTFQCVFDGTKLARSMNFDMDNPNDFTYSYRLDENSDYQDASYDEYNSAFLNVFSESEKTLVDFEYDRAAVFDAINNY